MAKTEFKQDLSSAAANAVYLLKTENDTITGILSLQNGGDVSKHITDLQEHLWTIGEIVGFVGESDPNALIYANENYIANGDSRKVAIEKLDAQMLINTNNIASNLVLITQNASDIQDIIDSIGVAAGLAPLGVGIASLDNDGKVPLAQLPNSLLQYQGTWDASTNTPTLDNTDTGVENYWYRVNVAGTVDFGAGNISFNVGDKVVNNGTVWEKWDTNDEVTSVFGRTGDVVAQVGDYTPAQVGLGNVTNDAQLKRAAGDFDTFTAKVTPVDADIVLIEDSEDSLNKKKITLANLLSGAGGGGGGSFLFESNGLYSPLEDSYKGISLLGFDDASNMETYAFIRVPTNYTPGDQIFLKYATFYHPAAAGNVLFKAETFLVRAGDDITAALNNHLSVNTELTLDTANEILEVGDVDLCDGSGEINGQAVAPGDFLAIRLYRDNDNETTPAVGVAQLFKLSPSVAFS